MNRKFVVRIMLIVTILSACSGRAPAATSAPTQAETPAIPVTGVTVTEAPVTAGESATAEAAATSTTAPETATATAEPTRPPNAPDCTNSAAFVADLTIPDNAEIEGNATFTKTWQVMNTGTCIWASDYKLTHYSEEFMGALTDVPLAVTYPGQTLDISVELTAPNRIGTHRAYFVIENPAGLIMKVNEDSRLWAIINVKVLAAATATATGAPQTTGATATSASTSSSGLANATCGYSLDQTRLLEVLSAVNAYRAQFNMSAYNVNPQLARAAQSHASDIACNQLFGHTGSNGSNVEQRIAASGYVAAYASENVYGSNPPLTAQGAVDWWVNDQTEPRHRLNLVSDTYIEIGIGYAFFSDYGYYVIVFATP